MTSILVVDDEVEVVRFVRNGLEDEGFSVDTAGDGKEAVEKGRTDRPSLVVLDMSLPLLQGDQVASELRRTHGPDLPILLITGDGNAAEKARRVGAYSYLGKPFQLDDLLAAVQQGLSHSASGGQAPHHSSTVRFLM